MDNLNWFIMISMKQKAFLLVPILLLSSCDSSKVAMVTSFLSPYYIPKSNNRVCIKDDEIISPFNTSINTSLYHYVSDYDNGWYENTTYHYKNVKKATAKKYAKKVANDGFTKKSSANGSYYWSREYKWTVEDSSDCLEYYTVYISWYSDKTLDVDVTYSYDDWSTDDY